MNMIKSIALSCLLVIIFSGFYSFIKRSDKTGYVQIQKVFNEFGYKKEMEAKLKRVEEIRKKELDSLELKLKILFKEVELNGKDISKVAVFRTEREAFLNKREKYENDYAKEVAQYDEIIVKQMNQYIKEYGEKNKYKYIFGTDGKGSLMYADSTDDLTADIIIYINDKYKGK
jgi:outer membrane protein